ncbi:hypothetical protein KC872_04365, partial [Candidatus Kaiserbacteria bacterium]|nr:hypothetical protein [Candidatus Kaiserbacteria bacterium]
MLLLNENDLKIGFEIGSKAQRLRELTAAGFNVPAFVVVPTKVVGDLVQAKVNKSSEYNNLLVNLQNEIDEKLPTDFYAVRSAALIEDGKTSSSAGQFKTILKVTKETLSEAILSVVDDARLKL